MRKRERKTKGKEKKGKEGIANEKGGGKLIKGKKKKQKTKKKGIMGEKMNKSEKGKGGK